MPLCGVVPADQLQQPVQFFDVLVYVGPGTVIALDLYGASESRAARVKTANGETAMKSVFARRPRDLIIEDIRGLNLCATC